MGTLFTRRLLASRQPKQNPASEHLPQQQEWDIYFIYGLEKSDNHSTKPGYHAILI